MEILVLASLELLIFCVGVLMKSNYELCASLLMYSLKYSTIDFELKVHLIRIPKGSCYCQTGYLEKISNSIREV